MASAQASAAARLQYEVIQSFINATRTCTSPWVLDYRRNLPGVTIDFHQLLIILSAVACIFASLIAMYLICGHLLFWTVPKEQKQIVRICLFIPIYSLCSFWAVWFYHADGFIVPIGQWYEGLALTALFLLYVEIAAPDPSTRESFFEQLERRWYSGKKKNEKGSLRWFRGLYIMVFQLFWTRIGTVITAEVIWGITCPLSPSRRVATTVITVIQSTSTSFAVTGCIFFETRLRVIMNPHLAKLKLISFKAVVFFESFQSVIFPILAEYRIYKPSPPWYVSWTDFAIGLPQFLLAIEIAFVSVSFLWSFHFNRYREQALHQGKMIQAGPGGALADSLTLIDIWQGVAYAFFNIHSSQYPHNGRTYMPVSPDDPVLDKTKVESAADASASRDDGTLDNVKDDSTADATP